MLPNHSLASPGGRGEVTVLPGAREPGMDATIATGEATRGRGVAEMVEEGEEDSRVIWEWELIPVPLDTPGI